MCNLVNGLLKTVNYTSSQYGGFHPTYECNLCNLYVCAKLKMKKMKKMQIKRPKTIILSNYGCQ